MKISSIILAASILASTSVSAREDKPNEYLPLCTAVYTVTAVIHKRMNSSETAGYANIASAFRKASIAELGEARAERMIREKFQHLMSGVDQNKQGYGNMIGTLAKEGCPQMGAAFKVSRFL